MRGGKQSVSPRTTPRSRDELTGLDAGASAAVAVLPRELRRLVRRQCRTLSRRLLDCGQAVTGGSELPRLLEQQTTFEDALLECVSREHSEADRLRIADLVDRHRQQRQAVLEASREPSPSVSPLALQAQAARVLARYITLEERGLLTVAPRISVTGVTAGPAPRP